MTSVAKKQEPNFKEIPQYYRNINPDVLRAIPRNVKAVLEFGCGAGALGEAYKQFNPKVNYTGVELSANAAEYARVCLDKVIEADIDKLNLADEGIRKGSIDCIIYGDLLEHLIDPWAALKKHAEYLSEDGMVIACIPNIQHWTIIHDLLKGQWQYVDHGLMDRTHLRFFTLETIKELFDKSGLGIVDIRPRLLPKFNQPGRMDYEKFIESLAPVIEAMGLDKNLANTQMAALQYVVRAVKNSVKFKKTYIHTQMLKPAAACNDVRVLEPHDFLSTVPGLQTTFSVSGTPRNIGQGLQRKVFFFQRPILRYETHIEHLKWLVNNNFLVLVEFDDHPERWPDIEKNNYLNYRGVHAVQTSTPPLMEFFKHYNPNVEIFPNQISRLLPFKPTSSDKITVFFGALNRKDDWKDLMPSINKVAQKFKDKIHFEVIFDQEFYDNLEVSDKNFTPMCEYPVYQEILYRSDISLMPLADTMFNHMKSDLKFIEAGALSTAALASPVVYEHSLKDNETGLLFRNQDEFEQNFSKLISDRELRLKLTKNAYEYVRENRMQSQHYMKRLEWIDGLLARLPELNEQLKERVPEIFS